MKQIERNLASKSPLMKKGGVHSADRKEVRNKRERHNAKKACRNYQRWC